MTAPELPTQLPPLDPATRAKLEARLERDYIESLCRAKTREPGEWASGELFTGGPFFARDGRGTPTPEQTHWLAAFFGIHPKEVAWVDSRDTALRLLDELMRRDAQRPPNGPTKSPLEPCSFQDWKAT